MPYHERFDKKQFLIFFSYQTTMPNDQDTENSFSTTL